MQLPHAIGQHRRAGVEDVRRLDLVQLAIAYRRDRLPARSGRHLFQAETAAAPGPTISSGARRHHVLRILDDALAAQRLNGASSAKQSSPPASSISSLTQPMPEISGSFHSSKYTRGLRGKLAALARMTSSPAWSSVVSAARAGVHQCAERLDHAQDAGNVALVEQMHLQPLAGQLGSMSACRSQ